jgi:hypothetical protein
MRFKPGIMFALLMVAVSGFAVFTARGLPFDTRLLPLVIGIPTLCLALFQLFRELTSLARPDAPRKVATMDLEIDSSLPTVLVIKRALTLFGYLVGLLIGITLVGFFISMPLFTFLYLKFQGKETWLFSLVLAAGVLLLIKTFDGVLHPVWIEGVVPWPGVILERLLNF